MAGRHEANSGSRRQRRETQRRRTRLALPFFLVLGALTVVAFLVPLRPRESAGEKRELAAFPAFSAEALFSGDYFDGVALWFADTFPGREGWLRLADATARLRGRNDVAIYDPPAAGDDIPVPTAPAAPDLSAPPADTPAPTPTPTPTPGLTDAYGNPLDESQLGAGTVTGAAETIRSIAVVGNAGYEFYSFSQSLADSYAASIARAAELVGDRARVFDIIVPNSMDIMLSDELRESLRSADQKAAIAYIYAQVEAPAVCVEVWDDLRAHNGEYIYFRTDHHWTGLGAWYAYAAFCESAGFEPVLLTDYTARRFDGFLGSFYDSTRNAAMQESPDTVVAYEPPGEVSMTITGWDGEDFAWPVVTDVSGYPANTKFSAFIGGDYLQTVLVNEAIEDDSACLLVKESYGNALAPFLTQHYHTVYVVDYRYNARMTLSGFVDAWGIDDVIYVNNISVLQSPDRVRELARITG